MPKPTNTTTTSHDALLEGLGNPTVAIITGGQGDSHRKQMQPITAALEKRHPDWAFPLIDVKVEGILRNKELQDNYDKTNENSTLNEKAWKEKLETPRTKKMRADLKNFILTHQPDAIIANYDVMVRLAIDIYKELGWKRPPIAQHLSDLGKMHRNWVPEEFSQEGSQDLVLTTGKAIIPGESDQKKWVLDRGVPEERIKHVGAPVRDAFTETAQLSREECRAKLRDEFNINIPNDKLAFLTISGTGHWPEKFIDTTISLAQSDLRPGVSLTAVAGLKEETKTELEAKIDPPIDVLGYTDEHKLALLMRAVNAVFSKGGAMGICEPVNVGTTVIIYETLPGPEHENSIFVKEQGIGLVALTAEEALKTAHDIVANPAQLAKIEQAQKAHVTPNSAKLIADAVSKMTIQAINLRNEVEQAKTRSLKGNTSSASENEHTSSGSDSSSDEEEIAEAAYYKAETRGFTGGEEQKKQDWYAAKAEVHRQKSRKKDKIFPAAELSPGEYSKCNVIKKYAEIGIVIGKPGNNSRKYLISFKHFDENTDRSKLQADVPINVKQINGKYLITHRIQEISQGGTLKSPTGKIKPGGR